MERRGHGFNERGWRSNRARPQEVRVLELVVTETMRSERIDSAADVDLEHPVIVLHRFGPWKWRRVVSGEPVAHAADCLVGVVAVDLYILAADIRQDLVITMRLRIEDQGALAAVPALAEEPCAEVKTQLHSHVEAGQAAGELDAREVVDNPVAFADHAGNLPDPDIGSV